MKTKISQNIENIIKNQITLNKCSIITGRFFLFITLRETCQNISQSSENIHGSSYVKITWLDKCVMQFTCVFQVIIKKEMYTVYIMNFQFVCLFVFNKQKYI